MVGADGKRSLVADAVVAGFGGQRALGQALAGYQRRRDEETLPMYEFTTDPPALRAAKVEEAAWPK